MFLALILLGASAKSSDVTGTADLGRGPARSAIIYLEGYGHPAGLKAKIEQKNKTFSPHILAVPIGSTVSFPNEDAIYHNVFAEYNAKKFDLGMYPHGQTRTVTFDKAGLVSVLCNVHSEMSAYILVVDSTAYAMVDRNGRFVLHNVRPGTYTLRGWHESGAKASQAITVGTNGANVEVHLKR